MVDGHVGGDAGGPSRDEAARHEAPSLGAGDRVRVRGLLGAAQHNGKEGVVRAYHRARERYAVELCSGGPAILVKRANLEPATKPAAPRAASPSTAATAAVATATAAVGGATAAVGASAGVGGCLRVAHDAALGRFYRAARAIGAGALVLEASPDAWAPVWPCEPAELSETERNILDRAPAPQR